MEFNRKLHIGVQPGGFSGAEVKEECIMIVKHPYLIDLSHLTTALPLQVIQGDTDTHALELELHQGSGAWNVPNGAALMVGYVRADGAGGTYDTLPDGSAAFAIRDYIVDAVIAAPMLAVPGPVRMTVYLLHEGQRLHIFEGVIHVRRDPAAEVIPPEDYVDLQQWISAMTPTVVQNPGSSKKAVMSQKAVTDALAKNAQHSPEFVSSTAACTDTARLYVLPDGYIYAYMGDSWQSTGRAYQAADYEDRVIGLEERADGHDAAIEELNRRAGLINSGDPTPLLPAYWQDYLEEKAAVLHTRHQAYGHNCFSFPVLTDVHLDANLGKYSAMAAAALMARCDMPWALCLGDLVSESGSAEDADQSFADAEEFLAPIRGKLLQTQGSRDGIWGSGHNLTPQKLHSLIYRKAGLAGALHFDSEGCGYYVDDVSNKVRYILLNSHRNTYAENEDGTARYGTAEFFRFGQSQYDLVVEALGSVPGDDWCVISASHAPLNDAYAEQFGGAEGDHVLMRKLLAAYKKKTAFSGSFAGTYGDDAVSVTADFTAARGRYIAHFSGCTHADSSGMFDGIRVVTTRCDARAEPSQNKYAERESGTTTEQSFDVVTVIRDSGSIQILKIGAGTNRFMSC